MLRRNWVVVALYQGRGHRYEVRSLHWTERAAGRRKQVQAALSANQATPLYVMPRRSAESLPGVIL